MLRRDGASGEDNPEWRQHESLWSDRRGESEPVYASYTPGASKAVDAGLVNQTRYDANGNVIAVIAPDGKVTRTYYDNLNRPTIVVRNFVGDINLNTPPAFDAARPDENVRSTTEYDANGNVVKTIDNAGRVNTNCYDALNRVVKSIQNPTPTDPCPDYTPSGDADKDLIQKTVYDCGGKRYCSDQ